MKVPTDSSKYISAAYYAERIGISCNVAFWMRTRSAECEDHHRLQVIKYFKDLAEELGYDVKERE
jgi:hypothetical protein